MLEESKQVDVIQQWTDPAGERADRIDFDEFRDFMGVQKPMVSIYGSLDHGLPGIMPEWEYVIEYRFKRRTLYQVVPKNPNTGLHDFASENVQTNRYFSRVARPLLPSAEVH